MSDLPRLLDDSPGELERTLLTAGKGYRASERARARTLAALSVGSSSLVWAAFANAGVSIKSLLLGGGVAGLAAVGLVVATHGLDPAPTTEVPSEQAFMEASAMEPKQTPPAVAETPPIDDLADVETDSVGERATADPALPSRVQGKRQDKRLGTSIAAELRALDEARQTLARGDGAGTLLLLDAYAHEFPRQRLGLEAEVLRIEALAKTGSYAAASARAQAFLQHHPDSVFAARVRRFTQD